MTALPMTLESTLRYQGYTIDLAEVGVQTINTSLGSLVIPAQVRSVLTWRRGTAPTGIDPALGDDLFLSKIPMFDEGYRAVLLSVVLDQFRTRRLSYDTPGEFRLALRRWGNSSMGVFNQRLASTAVLMPLDDLAVTNHTLDVASDFPQSQISGSVDYSTASNDRRNADNGRRRSIASLLEEQRTAYLNVNMEILDAMEPLFLGVFDRGELGTPDYDRPYGRLPGLYDSARLDW